MRNQLARIPASVVDRSANNPVLGRRGDDASATPRGQGGSDAERVCELIVGCVAERASAAFGVGGASHAAMAALQSHGIVTSAIATRSHEVALPGHRRFGPHDALVAHDVLGFGFDEEVLLRSLSKCSDRGTMIVGSVRLSDVGQRLVAPHRRTYSPELLDALLVRCGWTAPRRIGVVGSLMVFASERAASSPAFAALERADALPNGAAQERSILELASAAASTAEPSEVRELLLAIGEAHLARSEFDLAETSFAGANSVAPRCARPYVALANVALMRGHLVDAEALFDHALGLDPCNPLAWRLLATTFARSGQPERSLECLACAASLLPADADIAAERARSLAQLGDASGAADALEHALAFGGAAGLNAEYCWLAPRHRAASRASERRTTGTYLSAGALSADQAALAS